MSETRRRIAEAHHWVIKLGSAVLLRDGIHVDRTTFVSLVEGIDRLLREGRRVTVVSSGAVALGRQRLGEPSCPIADLPRLQALAALGQSRLIRMWDAEFAQYGHRAAQILFARSDLERRDSFLNARLTLDAVHRLGAIPIINENDSVATEELRFGDNDELAGVTTGLVQADVLVILSDIEGVLDVEESPDGGWRFGERIRSIAVDDPKLTEVAGPSTSGVGRGGMISKVRAARTAARFGAPTVIAPGKLRDVLTRIGAGDDVGTVIHPADEGALLGKKVWLGTGAMAVGTLRCDAGARRAVLEAGASLLPSGIVEVDGDFGEGSVIELVGPDGVVFGRGLAVYAAEDIRRIAGQQSDSIAAILGYRILDAVVHRDSLVLV